MRNKAIMIVLFFLFITILAYYKNINHKNISQHSNKADVNGIIETQQDNTKKCFGVNSDDNGCDITNMLFRQTHKIRFIGSRDKDSIYVATEEHMPNEPQKKLLLRLYNTLSNKTEKSIDILNKSKLYHFISLNNGLYVIEITDLSESKKVFYHIYDRDLNLIQTLDLTSIAGTCLPILSNGGDKIAYIDKNYRCIYICDLNLDTKRKVCEIEPCITNKLFTIEGISFLQDDKEIAFIGSVYKNDSNQPKAFGTVDINTGKIIYQQHDGIINSEIQTSSEGAFFYDATTIRGKESTGEVFSVNKGANDITKYELKDKNESQNAYISDKGTFIVTWLCSNSGNNSLIYKFRIYDAQSKNILEEYSTTFDTVDYYNCGIRKLFIREDSNSFYVVYKIGEEQKLYKYRLGNS